MGTLLKTNSSMPILKTEESTSKYSWCIEATKRHMYMFWLFDAVDLGNDVEDYKKADKAEQEFITNVMKLFTTNEVVIGTGYDTLCRIFKPTEVLMMLRQFNSAENGHTLAYSLFTDTVMPKEVTIYSDFLDIPVMATKTEYLDKAKVRKYEDYKRDGLSDAQVDQQFRRAVARMLAIYGGGGETISLFAQFAMLMAYQFEGKYPGLCQINEYSIKDESEHSINNCRLFRQYIGENPDIWDDELKFDIYEGIREMVAYEDALVDYLKPPHMNTEELKQYIRFRADDALNMLGMKANYNVATNPFPFMEEITGDILTDFFHGKVTGYSRKITGSLAELRAKISQTNKDKDR